MDKLTSMRVFVKAVEQGSFAAAAESLALSPQMVARHVAQLEQHLGAALLNRTTRRQSLTDVGRAYVDRCRQILTEVEGADNIAREMLSQPRGVLRVCAPLTFGAHSLAPFVTDYLTRCPEVLIDLSLSDRLVDPLEEGFDLLVRIGDQLDPALVARPLAPYRLVACASPAYLARRGMPMHPAELTQHDCLPYANWMRSQSCRWVFSRDGVSEEVQINGRLRSDHWMVLLRAATAGFGITLGPEDVLASEIAAGRLVRVLPGYEGPARPMHVLYPANRRPTAALRSFVEAMTATFGDR
ncbi:MAG: LysR family transcriptional regulator [Paludibacterium sp.]|uniref:LysR family transcriptional regulator n=1 Tax=Paludibacterium sp. TaxID=1917523 RepID=UPI0025F57372|nr:LysR family transcriptional regulator [Paludibacterium sp.]MBV8048425.1 LysR family transcriptional regulator [Paludibacterium sp.]MBV8647034.1 LysR family transcriptional regulator [Paludibacterium sp.]